jgi:hypothetical protein
MILRQMNASSAAVSNDYQLCDNVGRFATKLASFLNIGRYVHVCCRVYVYSHFRSGSRRRDIRTINHVIPNRCLLSSPSAAKSIASNSRSRSSNDKLYIASTAYMLRVHVGCPIDRSIEWLTDWLIDDEFHPQKHNIQLSNLRVFALQFPDLWAFVYVYNIDSASVLKWSWPIMSLRVRDSNRSKIWWMTLNFISLVTNDERRQMWRLLRAWGLQEWRHKIRCFYAHLFDDHR